MHRARRRRRIPSTRAPPAMRAPTARPSAFPCPSATVRTGRAGRFSRSPVGKGPPHLGSHNPIFGTIPHPTDTREKHRRGGNLRQRRRDPRTHACPLPPCGQAPGGRRRDGRGAATLCGDTGSSFRCGFAAEPVRGSVVSALCSVITARLFFCILFLFYFKPKAKPGAAGAAAGLVLLRRVGLPGMTGRPSAAPLWVRSRRCLGGHRAGAAGTALRAGRDQGKLPRALRTPQVKPHTGHGGLCSGPAALRNLRPSPAPPAPGLPGGGGRRGGLRRFLAVPPHHGRIQRAPPSSHFLQLLLHQSSGGRRDRAVAQPRGPPGPLPSAGTGAPSPGGRGRGWPGYAAGLAVTIPPFPRHFVTVLAFSQSRDRAGALGTGPRCAGAEAPATRVPVSCHPRRSAPGSGAGPGTRGHRRHLPPAPPRSPSRPAHAAPEGRDSPSPCRTLSRGRWHRVPGRCPQEEDAGARCPASLPDGPGTRGW